MKRASILALFIFSVQLIAPSPAVARTAAAPNPYGVVVDSVGTSAGSYPAGTAITVTGRLRAARPVVLAQVVAAVRDARGGNVDFPARANVGVGTTAVTLSFAGALSVAGSYTVQLAYYDGTGWSALNPVLTFTVTPAISTARVSGVYTGWPQNAGTLDAFGRFRGRAVGLAADYLDASSWANIEGPAWFTGTYAATPYAPRLLIGVPMLPTNDPSATLALGATGAYDGHFRQLARNLVGARLTNAIIRPGWEFNSPVNYPWSAVAHPADFAGYFRHLVTAMRSVDAGFTFDLCFTVAVDGTQLDIGRAWPGDGYVDFVGMDLYDMTPGGGQTQAQRWSWYLTAPGGLSWLRALAGSHGKRLSVDEWALASPGWGGGGDDPAFIQAMYDWMQANPVAHETYNNVHYPFSNGRLDDGGYPYAAAKYRALFGG